MRFYAEFITFFKAKKSRLVQYHFTAM